jgi:O-antigen ligase
MFFLITIFSLLFIFIAIKRLELAIQLLIFALPAYLIRFKIGPIPSNLLEVMIWVVFLVWFMKNYQQILNNIRLRFTKNPKSKIQNPNLIDYPFKWEIILLLIISFVSVGVAGFTDSSLGIWKAYFFEPLLLYIVVLNVFSGRQEQDGSDSLKLAKLLWPLAFSALAVSLVAIYQKLTGNLIDNPFWSAEATRRVVSVFGYPNAVGLYLGPLILVFIGWLGYAKSVCRAPKKFQLIIALSIFISLTAIIFARSKGAIVGVAAGLAIFALFANRKSRLATLAVLVLATISCATIPLAQHAVWEKLTLKDYSGTIRRIGWNDTWKMLSDGRLFFGAGLANFQNAIKPYHQEGFFYNRANDPDFQRKVVFNADYRKQVWQPLEIYLYPHNIFLNFWSELGLAGTLLFVWIIGKHFYISLQNLKSKIQNPENNLKYIVLGLMASMVVIVVHGLVDVPYFKNDLAVMFWLFVAMLSLVDLSNKSAKI